MLTRRERLNKDKGKYGKGWRKSRNGYPSKDIFANDRWVVIPPASAERGSMAFTNEDKAIKMATVIASELRMDVVVEHQIKKDGEWIEAPE